MFQHFKKQLNEILYHTFYANNQNSKKNTKDAKAIADIITNLLVQNPDDEFDECFRNNDKFNLFKIRLCKIYTKTESFYYDCSLSTPWKLVFVNEWIDKLVLHKLNIPIDRMIVTLEDTGLHDDYENDADMRPRFKWKYYYLTKETIEYFPGFDEDGVDLKGNGQVDWNVIHGLSQKI